MSKKAVVQITGAPVACKDGMKDTWREVAQWTAGQLAHQFGEAVQVEYFDLFDPNCPPLPPDAQLPYVSIDGERVSSGGKISIPALKRRLIELGIEARR